MSHDLLASSKETSPNLTCWQDMNQIQEYRERAAQARRLADSVLDDGVREQLETAASDYDRMADQLEDEATRGK
jgi:hypothetical protein